MLAEILNFQGANPILGMGSLSEEYLKNDGRNKIVLYGIAFYKKRCKVVVERINGERDWWVNVCEEFWRCIWQNSLLRNIIIWALHGKKIA